MTHSAKCAERGGCRVEAIADAETLRRTTMGMIVNRTADVDEMFHVLGACSVARAHLSAGHVHMSRQTYVAAAHALHSAIPALRGPDYSAACTRWGFDPETRCVHPVHGHSGPCFDAKGKTTETWTDEILNRRESALEA